MTEWWTYRPSDFLMFSARTYSRLVEGHNRDAWPAPLVAFALGGLALWLASRATSAGPQRARMLCALLALAWVTVAWAFHWQRYSEIFLGARYLGAVFAVQALLFVACMAQPRTESGSSTRARRATGWSLAAVGLVAYPLAAAALASSWRQAEVFGWLPDPTAMVTLGVVLATGLRSAWTPGWSLAVLPLLLLAWGLGTQWVLRTA